MTMKTWHSKAKQIIGALCRESYLQANRLPNGRMRKRHIPYAVPAAAEGLLDALNKDDEQLAKSIMAHDYDIQQVRNKQRI